MIEQLGYDLARRLAEHVRTGYAAVGELLRSAQGDPASVERRERNPGQGGALPMQVDVDANDLLRRHLLDFVVPGHLVEVAGEEADHDDGLHDLPDRTIFFDIDPVDGTSNFVKLGRGFSSNVVAYVMDRSAFRSSSYRGLGLHAFSAHIWDPVFDQHYWWSDQMETKIGRVGRSVGTDATLAPGLPSSEGDPTTWCVGTVGSKDGPNRDFINHLTAEHKIATQTLGGGPMVRSLVDQELTALVELKPTTVYDSAHLLLAMGLDLAVGNLDGALYGRTELIDMFGVLTHPKELVIEPYIVADSYETYQKLCGLVVPFRTS